MTLTARLDELADKSRWDFSDLRALFINCTLKKSPELSNTQGLAAWRSPSSRGMASPLM